MESKPSDHVYEWSDGSVFKDIYNMEPSMLWLLVFGRNGPSKQEEESFYRRTIEEIKLVGKCIASEGNSIVTKSMAEHISDFLNNLTRGLCMFEERYFPIEWRLQGECCEQKKFEKSYPEGKHTMRINTRLFQVPIVCKTTQASLVAKHIPEKLEEDSKSSVFHNVYRFYQNFLESAVENLCGYKIQWIISDGSLAGEMKWFKEKFPTKNIDFGRMQQLNDIDSNDCKETKRQLKRSVGEKAEATKKLHQIKKRTRAEKNHFNSTAIKTEVDDIAYYIESFVPNMVESLYRNPLSKKQVEESDKLANSDSIDIGIAEESISNEGRLSMDDCFNVPSSSTSQKLKSYPSKVEVAEDCSYLKQENHHSVFQEQNISPECEEQISYSNNAMNPLTVTIPKPSSTTCHGNQTKITEETEICLAPISSDSERSSCSTSTDPYLITVYEESTKSSPIEELLSMASTHEELIEDSPVSSGDELERLCEPYQNIYDNKKLKEKQTYVNTVNPQANTTGLKLFSFSLNLRKIGKSASVFADAFQEDLDEIDGDN